MLAGVTLLVLGVAVRLGLLAWFGNLPGDIRIESDNSRVFIPITSMIVISLVLTLLASLIGSVMRQR